MPVDASRVSLGPVLRRYLWFQVPGWVLVGGGLLLAVRFWGLPEPWAWAGFALWLVKDAVLFPVLRRAYEPDGRAPHGPIGERGVAETALDPERDEGWVRVGPELWRARLAPGSSAIVAGAPVRVAGVRGLVLQVAPERLERG
jgi:membrane protein implicated in regulation of membrane protease activity